MDRSAIRWETDSDGIVTLTMDDPGQSANTMNAAFDAALDVVIARLEAERDDIRGVIVTSAKKTFFAGGDVHDMLTVGPADAAEQTAKVRSIKARLTRLESIGRPVVAAINGAALGGGFEIALACHRRIVADVRGAAVGLPEVTLGLLPGGGGVVRTVRLIGLIPALEKVLLDGRRIRPADALELGLVDEIVAGVDDLLPAARAWIMSEPEPLQPWQRPGYRIPGGTPQDRTVAAKLGAAATALRVKLRGANLPAPRAVLAAASEGAMVDFAAAEEIETRYFVELLTSQIAKNIMRSSFTDMRFVRCGGSRPEGIDTHTVKRLAILGAGMMGAGIAYVAARHGIDVILKDVGIEQAERGKAYSRKLLERQVAQGRINQSAADELLARISVTADAADLAGADAVIEAVFEDPEVKQAVFAEAIPFLADDALLASNTSTLPITGLAAETPRPEDFIGMHFFSPVDRMDLVEVIVGKQTSDVTLARAIDLTLQLGKLPVVVRDSRGFFTSRTIMARLNEAVILLDEGVPAASIEQAGLQCGYPVAPLQLLDETTITIPRQAREAAKAAASREDRPWSPSPADAVIDRLIDELGRSGRVAGAGFYDYQDGKRIGLWPGLTEHFASSNVVPFEDVVERLLFAETIEAARCFDEGVITSAPDANVGSLVGIGFPQWTGGIARYVEQYEGGVAGFVKRAEEFAEKYGERFLPPPFLIEKANAGAAA